MSQKRIDAERHLKKAAFLEAYAELGVVAYAAKAAGVTQPAI